MDIVRAVTGDFAVLDSRGFSRRDWNQIRRESLGINVVGMPGDARGLDYLEPVFGWLRYLRVNSSTCDDLRLISEMLNLRTLAVGGLVKHGLPVSDLPPLEAFGGPFRQFPGIETLTSLTALDVTWRSDREPTITAPLRQLYLTEKAPSSSAPALRTPTALKLLSIYSARDLDLSEFDRFDTLEELNLSHCRRLSGVESLLSLRGLRSLIFENCPEIESYETLLGLRGVAVHVVGKNAFGAEFRSRASTDDWSLPPSRK